MPWAIISKTLVCPLSSHPEFPPLSDANLGLLFFVQSVESQQSRVVGRGL